MFYFLLQVLQFLRVLASSVAESTFCTLVPKSRKCIRGEVALVTGAGRGIGREYALQLSRLGAKVVCWDIDHGACKATADAIVAEGGTAWDVACDVSDRGAVRQAAKETREKVDGFVTILVNNAGVMTAKPFLSLTPDEVRRDYAVNVFSQYWTMFEFLPDMVENDHGHVLAMSSVAGVSGWPFNTVYGGTKFANKGMMESLKLELRQERPSCKVKTTTVLPYVVDTDMSRQPRARHPSFVPITSPADCARVAIDGMLRDEDEVFVPPTLKFMIRLDKLLPSRVRRAMTDFFVGANDDRD